RSRAGADGLVDLVAAVVDRAGAVACHHFPSARSVWITALAIGAATVPPNPPWVCAIVTATATLGLSAGANPMNQGWVSPEPGAPIDAVPVLPATEMPPSWAGVPVPS